jgi:hypothetical protein
MYYYLPVKKKYRNEIPLDLSRVPQVNVGDHVGIRKPVFIAKARIKGTI